MKSQSKSSFVTYIWLALVSILLGLLTFVWGLFLGNRHSEHRACVLQPMSLSLTHNNSLPSIETSTSSQLSSDHRLFSLAVHSLPHVYQNPDYDPLLSDSPRPLVLNSVFKMFHHPSHPGTSEILVHYHPQPIVKDVPYGGCDFLYLSRTGSLANMPNKCLAIASLPLTIPSAPLLHRKGKISGTLDQFQRDMIDNGAIKTERLLLYPFLQALPMIRKNLTRIAGPSEYSKDRPFIFMVLNEGVLDLFVNFLCSLKAAHSHSHSHSHHNNNSTSSTASASASARSGLADDLDRILVLAAQESIVPALRAMGIQRILTAPALAMDKKAAAFYGDATFAQAMWLKAAAVYLLASSGYSFLFQDVDLAWLQPAIILLNRLKRQADEEDLDLLLQDDGARTPRFTPLYVNSGFYYVRPTSRSIFALRRVVTAIGELAVTHSHQSVLTRYLSESLDLAGLRFSVLPMVEVPSGFLYHHEPVFMAAMNETMTIQPAAFHMCWTESREQKILFFKELGLWFLSPHGSSNNGSGSGSGSGDKCSSKESIMTIAHKAKKADTNTSNGNHKNRVWDGCCSSGGYWPRYINDNNNKKKKKKKEAEPG